VYLIEVFEKVTSKSE